MVVSTDVLCRGRDWARFP